MTHPASSLLRPPPKRHRPQRRDELDSRSTAASFNYGRTFWLAYASSLLLMVGVSLLYRYADFVTLLGGTEFHLGWIVGVGMVGSLVTRVAIGSYIDRHGARLVWLGSTALFVATCLAHLAVGSHTGVAIYLLRISYCCAVAGVYGASVTFVSAQGPSHRMAELIGMLGTSGFLGTVVGTLLGDFLLALQPSVKRRWTECS